jgi:hypothetical protein
MDMPDNTKELVDQLGAALIEAFASDEHMQFLAKRIQDQGFDVELMLEVAITLHKRSHESHTFLDSETLNPVESAEHMYQWSDNDKLFLKAFRISAE